MKDAEGVTEELKEQNQLEWVQRMGNIQQRAKEIVCSELIYSQIELGMQKHDLQIVGRAYLLV